MTRGGREVRFAEVIEALPVASTEIVSVISQARAAQAEWADQPVSKRLRLLKKFRHELARASEEVAAAIPEELPGTLHRSLADTLVAEVLPLAEACRFLEREAASILAPRHLSARNRPFWLRGVKTVVHREPFGVVLVIGCGNYPLLLPGVQTLQALAAGNAVLWKPAPGGCPVAHLFRLLLVAAGMDPSLLQILDEDPSAATLAIRRGVDKVFLTGSEATGRMVLHELAETVTPSVVELSGCDAVFILDGADLRRAVSAITFGLRLNGSATCMAPRRIFIKRGIAGEFTTQLSAELESVGPVNLPIARREFILDLLADAEAKGAGFRLNGMTSVPKSFAERVEVRPTLITGATPEMRVTQCDFFAPVVSIIEIANEEEALLANAQCPYALTASIFGPQREAQALARRVPAGSVLINDVIVATADPRSSFGGQKRSGFGATRGREGLLEMTTVKTIQTQHAKDRRAYAEPAEHHADFFAGYIMMAHGDRGRDRLAGAKRFLRAMTRLK